MKEARIYLGIDLSKKTMDVNVKNENGKEYEEKFDNNNKGFVKLEKWLNRKGLEKIHVCMEATNVYWEDVAEYLYNIGFEVSVVNPARIKGYAQSKLKRNKTDKVDARTIRQFCASEKPEGWKPPSEEEKKLRSLMRRHESLKRMKSQELNRRSDCKDADVIQSINDHIEYLKAEMKKLKAEMKELVKKNKRFKKDYKLLRSIQGIGEQTALLLLAELGDLRKYKDARALAADAGVTPKHYESGETVKKRPKMSKVGKGVIRGAMYLPAITAIRCNPIVQAFVQRLEAKNKHKLTIIGAAMRKLLHLAYGVVKNDKPFEPNYLFSS